MKDNLVGPKQAFKQLSK